MARCVAESPYKNCIGHGFLTLSLAPMMMYGMFSVGNVKLMLNYGTNKVHVKPRAQTPNYS